MPTPRDSSTRHTGDAVHIAPVTFRPGEAGLAHRHLLPVAEPTAPDTRARAPRSFPAGHTTVAHLRRTP